MSKKNKKKTLTFDRLRKTNIKRCEKVFHKLNQWSLSEWSNAMAGEVGEACNVTKKILRGDKPFVEYKTDLAKEIADVICYADLLAAAAGIDLGQAVIEKFNEVSDRRSTKIKL